MTTSRWRNARYFNEDSNVVRNSLLIVQLPVGESAEYINFHVGDLYRAYRKDGMEGVLPIVKRDIKDLRASATGSLSPLNRFGDYEAIREHLIIRPLNYDDNEKALARGVYRRVGDMAPILYVIASMLGGRPQMQEVPFMDDESVSFDLDAQYGPTLTTQQHANGAIAAFYPGVLDRLCRMAGGDVYVVFTSIHDVHIHPIGGKHKISGMRGALADTNRDLNQHGELLTRQIYRYSGDTKELT